MGTLGSNYNIFMGTDSGGGTWATTASNANIGIGHYVMDAAMNDAAHNTSVGYASMSALTEGDSNIAIGSAAGDVITTGGQNIIIGRDSDPSANSASNQTVIGYATTGVADNSVTLGNASVTAVYMAEDSGAAVYSARVLTGSNIGSTDVTEASADVVISSASEANLYFNDTGASSGSNTARIDFYDGDFHFQTMNDAGTSVTSTNVSIMDSGFVGIGDSSPNAHLKIEDATVTTGSAHYHGLFATHTITDATNGYNMTGFRSDMIFNDSGNFSETIIGGNIKATCTNSSGEATTLTGINAVTTLTAGDFNNIYGMYSLIDVDAGTVDAAVIGQFISVDIESGMTAIGGSVYGIYMTMDDSQTAAGVTYGIKTDLGTHIDYAYQTYDLVGDTIAVQISRAGQIDAEGSINASQALDYAEYFESKDGKVIANGTSVKLDGDKIVACSEGDTPLGVIRPKSAKCMVGGSQAFHWLEKYMKDDYGADVMEDYTLTKWVVEVDHAEYIKRGRTEQENLQYSKVEGSKEVLYKEGDELPEGKEVGDVKEAAVADTYFREHKYHSDRIPDSLTAPDDAEVITAGSQRQKLNPDYDDSKEYKSREERDEWHIVGLLGQIPITKGQPTGNWIKMKDVSDTVEMYFVK